VKNTIISCIYRFSKRVSREIMGGNCRKTGKKGVLNGSELRKGNLLPRFKKTMWRGPLSPCKRGTLRGGKKACPKEPSKRVFPKELWD